MQDFKTLQVVEHFTDGPHAKLMASLDGTAQVGKMCHVARLHPPQRELKNLPRTVQHMCTRACTSIHFWSKVRVDVPRILSFILAWFNTADIHGRAVQVFQVHLKEQTNNKFYFLEIPTTKQVSPSQETYIGHRKARVRLPLLRKASSLIKM